MLLEMKNDIQEYSLMPRYDYFTRDNKPVPQVYRGRYWCYCCGDWIKEYTRDKRYNIDNCDYRLIDGTDITQYVVTGTHYYMDGNEVSQQEIREYVDKEIK